MTLPDLLIDLGQAGVLLREACGGLGFTPESALTTARAAAIALHRAAILDLLAGGYAPEGESAAYVFGERMGIADGLGTPTDAGSPAWMIAVGESLKSRCEIATQSLSSGHGPTDGRDCGGDSGERGIPLRDRQGRGSGP